MNVQHQEKCVSTNSLLNQLKPKSWDSMLRCNRLCCYGHVNRSELYTGQILTWKWKEIEVAIVQRIVG